MLSKSNFSEELQEIIKISLLILADLQDVFREIMPLLLVTSTSKELIRLGTSITPLLGEKIPAATESSGSFYFISSLDTLLSSTLFLQPKLKIFSNFVISFSLVATIYFPVFL